MCASISDFGIRYNLLLYRDSAVIIIGHQKFLKLKLTIIQRNAYGPTHTNYLLFIDLR